VDRLFPLSLAAEGSCTIGGNLPPTPVAPMSCRYGNTRDLVLGLEVVLPDAASGIASAGCAKTITAMT